MRIRNLGLSILCLAMITLSGCGGGGGGAGTAAPSPAQGTDVTGTGSNAGGGADTTISAPTKGVLKMATAGAAATIAGIDVTINLPAGVTVAADPVTGEVVNGVVTVSGGAAFGTQNLTVAKLTPASAATPAQLHISMANMPGLNLGEFATVQFDLTTGTPLPAASAFTVKSFLARGLDGAGLSGITAAPLSVGGI